MSTSDPKVHTVESREAPQKWGQLLKDVVGSHNRVIVEEGGVAVAAIIPVADLERLKHLEQKRQRDFAVVGRMRAAFEGVPLEAIEQEAAKALAEVRAEIRGEDHSAPTANS
jgi:hypothetical protein